MVREPMGNNKTLILRQMHQAIEFAIHSGMCICTISACKTALVLATVAEEQLKRKRKSEEPIIKEETRSRVECY